MERNSSSLDGGELSGTRITLESFSSNGHGSFQQVISDYKLNQFYEQPAASRETLVLLRRVMLLDLIHRSLPHVRIDEMVKPFADFLHFVKF